MLTACPGAGQSPAAATPRGGEIQVDPGDNSSGSSNGHAVGRTESAAVGTLEGAVSVSASGTAQYGIPLVAVPGRRGIEPDLHLGYDSGAGNGLLAPGWSIGGLSQIHRCSRDLRQDEDISPVGFSNEDPLCLDGKRLIALDGDYGADGTRYRTSWDSLATIEQVGKTDDWVAHFIVYSPDGLMRTYGGTNDSMVLGRGATRSWALRTVEDRWDNVATYEYASEQTVQHYGGSSHVHSVDHRPAAIVYGPPTDPSSRRVEFFYGERPEEDQSVGFWFGARSEISLHLDKIQMIGPGEDLVREYRIGYRTDKDARTVVDSLRECDGAGVCKPPTSFDYTEVAGVSSLELGWDGHPWMLSGDGPDRVKNAHAMDVDGDGYGDLLIDTGSEYRMLRSHSASTLDPVSDPVELLYESGERLVIADLNADGRDDVVRVRSDGVNTVISTTSPNSDVVSFTSGELQLSVGEFDLVVDAVASDFDGDSLTDLMYCRTELAVECFGSPEADGPECSEGDESCEESSPETGCEPSFAKWTLLSGSGAETPTGIYCAAGCKPGGCGYQGSYIVVDFDHDGTANLLRIYPELPVGGTGAPSLDVDPTYHAIVFNDDGSIGSVDTELPADLFQRYNIGVSSTLR